MKGEAVPRDIEDVLKGALLLEQRGKAFYEKSASDARDPAVKELFSFLAEEEVRHLRILGDLFRNYRETGKAKAPDAGEPGKIAEKILTDKVKAEISAASYEAAAIYAAMGFEDRAMSFYAEEAEKAEDPEIAKLFRWLADWERKHLELLMAIDEELRQRIWYDQRFWRF